MTTEAFPADRLNRILNAVDTIEVSLGILARKQSVNYPTLHAFGVLRVGLVRELGLEPVRVGGVSALRRHCSGL